MPIATLTPRQRNQIRQRKQDDPTASAASIADWLQTRHGIGAAETTIRRVLASPMEDDPVAPEPSETVALCIDLLRAIAEDQFLRGMHRAAARRHLKKLDQVARGELAGEGDIDADAEVDGEDDG